MTSDMYVDMSDAAIASLADDVLVHLVTAGAVIVRDEIVAQMEPGPPRAGAQYPIPGTGATYTASAPGQPPAVREAIYVNAWKTDPAVRSGNEVVAYAFNDRRVGKNDEYLLGELLEGGTNDLVNYQTRMEPRPHIGPGIEAAIPKIEKLISEVQSG